MKVDPFTAAVLDSRCKEIAAGMIAELIASDSKWREIFKLWARLSPDGFNSMMYYVEQEILKL